MSWSIRGGMLAERLRRKHFSISFCTSDLKMVRLIRRKDNVNALFLLTSAVLRDKCIESGERTTLSLRYETRDSFD